MQLSLSVRIAEGFLSKEIPILPLADVIQIAQQAGYDSLCMRASQLGVHSPREEVANARRLLDEANVGVTMVTGDFDTVYNNEAGPNALQRIEPYLDLAEQLGAPLVRVALKQRSDIAAAQRAADQAAQRNITLVHQCHTLSLFETLDGICETLAAIDRPNFGVIYEPANLELCGQPYGVEALQRLKPWLRNVYLQNQRLHDAGAVELDTWCRGPSRLDVIPVHSPGGLDFPQILSALSEIEYSGPITIHQSAADGQEPVETARETAEFLRAAVR